MIHHIRVTIQFVGFPVVVSISDDLCPGAFGRIHKPLHPKSNGILNTFTVKYKAGIYLLTYISPYPLHREQLDLMLAYPLHLGQTVPRAPLQRGQVFVMYPFVQYPQRSVRVSVPE